MAGTKAGTRLITVETTLFDNIYNSGDEVPISGIYRCQNCGREVTSNAHPKDNIFPPHNTSSSCKNAKWQLYVVTDTNGNNFSKP